MGKELSLVLPGDSLKTGTGRRFFHFVAVLKMVRNLLCMVILLIGAMPSWCSAGVLVIGHETLESIDTTLLRRIYTGRVVIVQGQSVQPVNQKASTSSRTLFIKSVMKQNDDDYVAYWIVRRAIGKGTPPLELENDAEVLDYVQSNQGAIGYIDAATSVSGVEVLLSLP